MGGRPAWWNSPPGRYVVARTLSAVGNLAVPVAMVYTLVEHLGKGAGAVSAVLAAQILGNALFVLLGGVLADRFSALRTMVFADLVRMSVQLALAGYLLAGGNRISLFAALVFLHGTMAAQFNPAAGKFLKTGIAAAEVARAGAGAVSGASAAAIAGPLLGALLVGRIGPAAAYLFDAVTFASSAALLLSLLDKGSAPVPVRAPTPVPASAPVTGPAGAGRLLREVRYGLTQTYARRWLMAGMVCTTVIGMIGGGVLQVVLPLVASHFGGAEWVFSGWQASLGLGGMLGGLLAVTFKPAFPLRAMCPFVALACVPFITLVAHAPVLLTFAAFTVLGTAQSVLNVLWQTTMTHHVPSDVIGRVSSLGTFSALVGLPAGLAVSALVIEHAGVAPVLWIGAGGTLLASLLMLTPSARHLPAVPTLPCSPTGAAGPAPAGTTSP